MKKFFKKLAVSLMALSMIIPAYTMTAHAEIVEYLDYYRPQDPRTGWYEFEHYDTDWEATVHPYIDNLNRARSEAIQKAEANALMAEADKTGYPFVKIPAKDFLCNYQCFGWSQYLDNNGQDFDAETYAAMYPEVKEQYGNKFTDLWNHYKTIGVYEGRVAHTNGAMISGYDAIMALYEVWTPEMTDREKVIFVNNYFREKFFPIETNPGVNVDESGQHANYARGYEMEFTEVMRQLGIPCIRENSYEITDPQDGVWDSDWNQVYIDGKWYVVDVYMNDFTNSDQYLLIDRHPLAYPDYWAEKNIQVYSTTVLKPTYTEADLAAGEMTQFMGGGPEEFQWMLDQDFADAILEEGEKQRTELFNTEY
ncbi:MAG: transglutaminase domain-containing protein [Pseudobutyrivibrio sp.]|nr:transglutaminase domain-containing protein [Pseudobutyrivibrio sp.]